MHELQNRNPLIILVFTALGAGVRYIIFNLKFLIRGEKPPKSFWAYSDGFQQIVYNLLLMLFFVFAVLIWVAYTSIQAES